MHADLNFKLVRIIYALKEKQMYVATQFTSKNDDD